MPAKRAGPVMRMTPSRYTRRQANWPNAGTGRTSCSTRTDVETALAAGQRITLADGVTIGTVGDPEIVVPSGADIRGATYATATLNVNLNLNNTSGVVLEGFRMGSRASILGTNVTSLAARWLTCLGAGLTDYGIRLQNASDCHLFGCIARRYRVYGISLEDATGPASCSVRQTRWEQIGRTPPVLDGVTECGLNFQGHGVISGCEGSGSAWAEIRLTDQGGGGTVIDNARLDGRIGIDIVQGVELSLRRCRVVSSLYGVNVQPGHAGQLAFSTIEDVTVNGGVWGVNLEQVANPIVRRIVAAGQSGACIREASAFVLLDRPSCDLTPAPGGVDVLVV